MNDEKARGIIEAVLFSTGRVVKIGELINILELSSEKINEIISQMQLDYSKENRGIELVRVEDGFTLASKKDYYGYLYPALDKRIKPKLSQASLEVLAIIAYNPRVTRADVDTIRGVDSSASIYRLLEYDLIEPSGKADLPGKPMTYKTTKEFLKMFGLQSLKDLPELPKYKLDSNRQIVIDDMESNKGGSQENSNEDNSEIVSNELEEKVEEKSNTEFENIEENDSTESDINDKLKNNE